MKFAGDDKESPDDFLAELNDCRKAAKMSDMELLRALPSILSKNVGRWYRSIKRRVDSWEEFKKAFKH